MIETLPLPRLLGLFQKRIDGDDALLHLAGLRFKEMGLGTEFYAETPEELSSLLKFKPEPQSPAVAHLRRGIDLFEKANLNLLLYDLSHSNIIQGIQYLV